MKIKMYLKGEDGIDPCYGVDEIITVALRDIESALKDYKYYIITNEGFTFADNPLLVEKYGKKYTIEYDVLG